MPLSSEHDTYKTVGTCVSPQRQVGIVCEYLDEWGAYWDKFCIKRELN